MKLFIFFFLILFLQSNVSTQDANPSTRSFIWHMTSTTSSEFRKHFLGSCATTPIAQTTFFQSGAVFAGATLYSVSSAPFQLFTVDTATGIHTLVANITGVPPANNLTGIAWDYTTGTMFASVTTLTTSQIARVNITTGVMTPIGSPTAVAAGVTAIAISPTGDLFAVDAITDNLYRFNKTTGVAILVGPTGSNINTLTDIQFDYTDSLAYTINNNQLRVSSSPGGGTLVCTFVGNTPIAFAIKPPSNLIGIISGQTIPLEFFIEQNYPNPFNPTTKIKFGISKSANVKLTVYDVLGKEVAVLVNEDKLANTYEVQFDASAFPSGVYFYKIAYGEFTSTRKMLLVK